MAHVRQQLRAAVVAAISGLPTCGARVFPGRVYDVRSLPGARVYTPSDEVVQTSGRTLDNLLDRPTEVVVEVVAGGSEGTLDNTLDTACEEIEAALAGGVTVSGTLVVIEYRGVDITLNSDGAQPIGEARLRFIAYLYAAAATPGTLL